MRACSEVAAKAPAKLAIKEVVTAKQDKVEKLEAKQHKPEPGPKMPRSSPVKRSGSTASLSVSVCLNLSLPVSV